MAQSRLRIYRVWVSIASPACNHLYIYIGSLHLPFVQDEQGTLLESDLVDTNAPVESFLAGIAGDSAGNASNAANKGEVELGNTAGVLTFKTLNHILV